MRIKLPWPPSLNSQWRSDWRGWTYVTKETRLFREAVKRLFPEPGLVFQDEDKIRITILLHAKTRRKFDVDNRIKPILDALQGFVYSDDFQVDDVRAVRRGIDPGKQGYANVIIEKIGGKECKVQKRSTNTKTLTAGTSTKSSDSRAKSSGD